MTEPTKKRVSKKTTTEPANNVILESETVIQEVSKQGNKANVTTKNDLLTEEEILRMHMDDYMNDAQLAFFKARLEKNKSELLEHADKTTENLRETEFVPDPVDRASIEEEHALELRTRDRERKLLAKIEQSLRNIETGSYGWCDETGEPIGIARLLARPTANLCLEAQERREHRQKMYGD